MNKYEKAKIYKLIDNTNGNIYIGSTIQSLANRKSKHKQIKNKCKSKLIIDNGDYDMILIENYPCSSKEELIARERYFIENIECINKNIPGRTKKELQNYNKEWYNDNKERILKKAKEKIKTEERKEYEIKYANENKDLINTKSKEWYKNNKDKKKEYDKKYKDDKKEHYKKYFKEHQQINKERISKYKKQLADYQNSWCGNYITNYDNSLLKISIDIFE